MTPLPSSLDTTWAPEGALGRLQSVLTAWQARGASFVPLPWTVPPEFLEKTRPPHKSSDDFMLGTEGLVASGEQAFLWLDAEDRLPSTVAGVYIGWTPCFREEPVYDALHQRAFIKAELYAPLRWDGDPDVLLQVLRDTCRSDFAQLCPRTASLLAQTLQPDGSWDIELGGVEVGSYGLRQRPNGRLYAYGTALAEPRWSVARERALKSLENHASR